VNNAWQSPESQRAARNIAADTHVAKLALLRTQASFDIPQTFATGKLCKCYATILIEAGEVFDLVVAAIRWAQRRNVCSGK